MFRFEKGIIPHGIAILKCLSLSHIQVDIFKLIPLAYVDMSSTQLEYVNVSGSPHVALLNN